MWGGVPWGVVGGKGSTREAMRMAHLLLSDILTVIQQHI